MAYVILWNYPIELCFVFCSSKVIRESGQFLPEYEDAFYFVAEENANLCLASLLPLSFNVHAQPISAATQMCASRHIYTWMPPIKDPSCQGTAGMLQWRNHGQITPRRSSSTSAECSDVRREDMRPSPHIWVVSWHAKCHPSGHELAPQSSRLQPLLYGSDSKARKLKGMQNIHAHPVPVFICVLK